MLREGLLQAEAVKRYQSYINDECYQDKEQHNAEWTLLESKSLIYDGDARLATMPTYILHDDAADLYSGVEDAALSRDGKQWIQTYLEDVQYKASRLQHHIHRINPQTKRREPLRSCLSKCGGSECKHGFPKTSLLTDEPL